MLSNNDLHEFEWKKVDTDTYEKAYKNMNDDLLYVEDQYKNKGLNQTKFDDWEDDRYAVKLRRQYEPVDREDSTLHTSMSLEDAENFLDGKRQE